MAARTPTKLIKALQNLRRSSIVLVLSDSEKYMQINTAIIKTLTNQGLKCIYVSVNRPADTIMELFKRKRLKTANIYFVDCVSEMSTGTTRRTEKVIYTEPNNLTAISISVNEMINGISGDKFVFFDSLSTLLIYNSVGTIERFSHFVTNRIRLANLRGVLLSIERDKNKNFLNTLRSFCDEVITVD